MVKLVECPDVIDHILLSEERFPALIAAIRSFPSVKFLVSLQLASTGECEIALITLNEVHGLLIGGSDVVVQLLVVVEIVELRVGLITDIALVWSLCSMGVNVKSQLQRTVEGLVALLAAVSLLLRMLKLLVVDKMRGTCV